MCNNRIQIYILCRDRPEFFQQVINSVLIAADGYADVIISDNSETNAVAEIVKSKYSHVKYIRRDPPTPAGPHFNKVFDELSAEFYVLFHDDDIMMPDYCKEVLKTFDNNPYAVAVGCNALELRDNATRLISDFNNEIVIDKQIDFFNKYIGFRHICPVPFPGYMYRRSLVNAIRPDGKQGGKFADFSFLCNLIKQGSIIWLPQPLMIYRIHANNDFNTPSTADRLSLLRYFYSIDGVEHNSVAIQYYRFNYLIGYFNEINNKNILNSHKTKRAKIIKKFIIFTHIKFLFTQPKYIRSVLGSSLFGMFIKKLIKRIK